MNMDDTNSRITQPEGVEQIRQDRKNKLAAALRLFGKFGFDEGVAGHITVRDPELTDHFWVNPMGRSFKQVRVSELLLVSHTGEVIEGPAIVESSFTTVVVNPGAAAVRQHSGSLSIDPGRS